MVDDLGAVFKQQFAWLLRLVQRNRAATHHRPGDNAGLDLADRCSDAVVAFCAHALPMHAALRESLSKHVAQRHRDDAPAALPPALHGVAGMAKATAEAQVLMFGRGGAYNGHQEPGYQLLEVHTKGGDGSVSVRRDEPSPV